MGTSSYTERLQFFCNSKAFHFLPPPKPEPSKITTMMSQSSPHDTEVGSKTHHFPFGAVQIHPKPGIL